MSEAGERLIGAAKEMRTMVPTMRFRWVVISLAAYAVQSKCQRLQQLHHTSDGDKWVDVPMVEEEPSRIASIGRKA